MAKQGKMITADERQQLMLAFEKKVRQNLSADEACRQLDVSLRTLQRWRKRSTFIDGRTLNRSKIKKSALTTTQLQVMTEIFDVAMSTELSIAEIYRLFQDAGKDLPSASTTYRYMRKLLKDRRPHTKKDRLKLIKQRSMRKVISQRRSLAKRLGVSKLAELSM